MALTVYEKLFPLKMREKKEEETNGSHIFSVINFGTKIFSGKTHVLSEGVREREMYGKYKK